MVLFDLHIGYEALNSKNLVYNFKKKHFHNKDIQIASCWFLFVEPKFLTTFPCFTQLNSMKGINF